MVGFEETNGKAILIRMFITTIARYDVAELLQVYSVV